MLAIPALTLVTLYCGCLWLIPGRAGTFAALASGVLFVSSSAVADSTELAPHHFFALLSVAFLFLVVEISRRREAILLVRSSDGGGSRVLHTRGCIRLDDHAWDLRLRGATTAADWLAYCLEVDRALRCDSDGCVAGCNLQVVFRKRLSFLAYLGLFRKSPWGNEGFLDVWGHRVLDSPLEWAAIAVSLYLLFRTSGQRQTYPVLVYISLMLLVTARVVTSSTRYSLLFMPALDIFAALTLAPFLAASPARILSAAVVLFSVFFGIGEYREFTRNRTPDPRPPAILNYIRKDRLENATLAVPQEDLPMIHFYFPRMHLHGYAGDDPGASGDGILYRGYPVRLETAR